MFLKFGQFMCKKTMYNNAFHNIAGFSLTLFGKISMNLNLNKKLDLFNKKKQFLLYFCYHFSTIKSKLSFAYKDGNPTE
jgi:hypothetical protein